MPPERQNRADAAPAGRQPRSGQAPRDDEPGPSARADSGPHRCPVCRRLSSQRRESGCWPFCGPRCKLADLGRWLGGDYRIELPAEGTDHGRQE